MTKRLNIPKLPEKNRHVIVHDGIKKIVVFNVNGAFFAINQRCPHGGAPLSNGSISVLNGVPRIKCPRHGWEFNLTDGVCEKHPLYCATFFKVETDGNQAYLLI